MPGGVLLDVRGLTKSYGRTVALKNFTARLQPGRVVGLLGPNGSGKTTCLHTITGLLQPDAGHIEFDGVAVDDPTSRLKFGFAPDDLPLPGALSGAEYLRMHDALRKRRDYGRAMDLVAAFGLAAALDQQIDEYSHGMRRKIQLIAAAMHGPGLLILDEPFRGLDPDAVAVLRELMATFVRTGRGVMLATHDMALAEARCDEVLVLSRGELKGRGHPADLVGSVPGSRDLEDAFFTMTGIGQEAAARRDLVADAFIEEGG